jgi:hypothetical protein
MVDALRSFILYNMLGESMKNMSLEENAKNEGL